MPQYKAIFAGRAHELVLTLGEGTKNLSAKTVIVNYHLEVVKGVNRTTWTNGTAGQSYSVVLGGTTVTSGSTLVFNFDTVAHAVAPGTRFTIARGSYEFAYGTNGTLDLSVAFSANANVVDGVTTIMSTASYPSSGTVLFTPSPMAVSLATQPTVTPKSALVGNSVTIALPRQNAAYTHDVTYVSGTLSGTIGTGLATSATWTVPNVTGEFPGQTQSPITITAVTKNGATVIGTKSATLMVWNTAPSVDYASLAPYDLRVVQVGWDGSRLRSQGPIVTNSIKLVDTFCSTPTLEISTSGVVPGADKNYQGVLVLLEVQTGSSWRSTGLLYVLSRSNTDDIDITRTTKWTGIEYVNFLLGRAYQVKDYKTSGSGTNAGNIFRSMFSGAKARGWGPNVAASFPADKTSAGNGWIESGGEREISGGTPYSQVLEAFVNDGWCEFRTRYDDSTGFAYLDLFNPLTGSDWTRGGGTIVANFATAPISQAPVDWSMEGILDRIWAVGDAATGDPTTSEDNTAAPIASSERTAFNANVFGKMEGWASASGQTTAAGVREVAKNALANASKSSSRQFSYSATAVSRNLLPYVTFKPGDWVMIPNDRNRSGQPVDVRVMQVTIDRTADDVTITVICGDLFPAGATASVAKRLRASTGGRIAGGTLKEPMPLQTIVPAAPNFASETAAVSTGYWTSTGEARAKIDFSWLPVTKALDGVTPVTVDYYEVWTRPNPGVEWALKTFSTTTEAEIVDLPIAEAVQLQVRGRSTGGVLGEFSAYNEVLTVAPTASIPALTVNSLYTDGLGNIFADWDGNLGTGANVPSYFAYMGAEISPDNGSNAPTGVWTVKGNSLSGAGTITINPGAFGKWWVRFRAYDALGGPGVNGTSSSITTVDPGLAPAPEPKAPTGLTATAQAAWDPLGINTGDYFLVSWAAVSQDITNAAITIAFYEVDGLLSGGSWENVLRTSGTTGRVPVIRNQSWSFRVRAVGIDGGVSAWSTATTSTAANAALATLPLPSAPEVTSAKASLYVEWNGLTSTGAAYAADSGFRYAYVEVASDADLVVRTNLWKNPSVETNTTGFLNYATSGAVARITTRAYSGTACLNFTTSTTQTYAANALLFGSTTTTTSMAAVAAGVVYTASVYVFTNVDRYLVPTINFRTAAGAQIGTDPAGPEVLIPASTWTRVTLTATSPATSAFAGMRLSQGASGNRVYTTGTDYISTDGYMLEAASAVGSYYDGSTVLAGMTYAWTGTAHLSTSTAQVTTPWSRVGSAFPGRAGTSIINGLPFPGSYHARIVAVDGTNATRTGASVGPTPLVGVSSSDITPGTILGDSLSDDFADGATITGALIQTDPGATDGVKIASGGLVAYDAAGNPTFLVDAATGSIWFGAGTISGNAIDVSTIDVGTLQASLITNGIGDNLMVGARGLVSIISGIEADVASQGDNLSTFFDFGATGQWKSGADATVAGLRISSASGDSAFNSFAFENGFQIRRGSTALSWWEADSTGVVRFVAPNATILNDLNVGSHKMRPGAAGITIISMQ